MRTILILLAAAAIAGLAWAQPFGPNDGQGPVARAAQVQAQVLAKGDGDCIGAETKTMTRTGRGEGGQAMLRRQAADGQHAVGPKGAQRRAGRS